MSSQNFPIFTLIKDEFGNFLLEDARGIAHRNVMAVRAFPISVPEKLISLVDVDGHEVAWIESLDELPLQTRQLVSEALQIREFMPRILEVYRVSSFSTPSIWSIRTDRGATSLQLKGEEDIRRMGPGLLIVQDAHGVQYLIKNLSGMDKKSRKLLDRFL